MIGVVLVYAGSLAAVRGGVCLVRPIAALGLGTRGRAAIALGVLVTFLGFSLPASLRQVADRRSRLDVFVPAWQFAERHETLIKAPPARVLAAAKGVTADEIRLFRTLTWIRHPRRRRPPWDILNPEAGRPLLDVATSSGFMLLAEDADREIVLGTLVARPSGGPGVSTPQEFAVLALPGYAKAAMNFLVEDAGAGTTRLITETRVFATDDSACRRFAAYWRIIYPGSALIRRMWLRAIKARAEAAA